MYLYGKFQSYIAFKSSKGSGGESENAREGYRKTI